MTTKASNTEPLANEEWEIYPLDVGQGSASLIISPKGTTTVIDADEEQVAHALDEVLDRRTESGKTEPKTIDHFVVTHIHDDHVDGVRVLKDAGYTIEQAHQPSATRYEVGKSGRVKRAVLGAYLEALSDHGITIQDIEPLTTGDEIFQEDDVSLTALSPPATDETITFERPSTGRKCKYRPEKANANGVACKLAGTDVSCLFMGDMENDAAHNGVSWLVAQHNDPESEIDLDADILIGPHHGSKNAMTSPLLGAAEPSYATISSSLDNEYDHPHDETFDSLDETEQIEGVTWTAVHGTLESHPPRIR